MISTTACEVASSRASRWFSARNRAGSSFPPTDPWATRCGRRGAAVSPRLTASRPCPLPDLGLVQALAAQHRSLVLGDHPGPVRRGERAPDRTGRRIHRLCRTGPRMVTGTGKNWTVATHETVSCHHLHGGPGGSGVSHYSLTGRGLLALHNRRCSGRRRVGGGVGVEVFR